MSRKRKRLVRPGRGSLFLIGSLLITSALIRVSTEAGQAWARGIPADGPTRPLPGASEVCEPEPDIKVLLDALREREQALKLRERQIDGRMQALSVADSEISEKLAALTKAEEELRATIALSERAAEDDLSKLTSVYENMKPKDAAALFEEMAPEFAAGFLGRMTPGAAAGIMAGLSPQAAYTVSVILAGRNAQAPRE